MKKTVFYEEYAYLLALLLISFSTAMCAAADFGVSMVVAPAYVLSLKLTALTFGQCEYIVQGTLFVVMLIILKKAKPIYLFSFVSCLLYGFVLDLSRRLVPAFDPAVCAPGSFAFPVRLTFFVVSSLITALSIAVYMRSYVYCQVYDFFVKTVSIHKNIAFRKFKTCYDIASLVVGVGMSFLFFGALRGIGLGTAILAVINGTIIDFIGKLLDRYFEFRPKFPRLAKLFE